MSTLPLLFALLPQSSDLPDAAVLLDRREAALGPRERREAVRGLEVRGQLEMPGTDVRAPFEELHLLAPEGERVRITCRWGGWGATTQGTDGERTWSTDSAFGILVKEGAAGDPQRRLYAILRSAPWRSLYTRARTLGRVERAGRSLFELELEPPKGPPERWYLTTDTNELQRVALAYPGPAGETVPMEWSFGDWRAEDGVLYAHRRVQEILGTAPAEASRAGTLQSAPIVSIVYRCDSIRPGPLDPARLDPPEDVMAALDDPSKRTPAPSPDLAECKLEPHEVQPTATVRLVVEATKVSATLAVVLPEIGRALGAQRARIVGPPFSRYHAIDPVAGTVDLEAGIPVATAIEASGRVVPGELPEGRVATTWHIGSYHQLQRSYDRLEAWMKAQALTPRGGFWEIYWTDPGLEPDPSTWRTQILWPVE